MARYYRTTTVRWRPRFPTVLIYSVIGFIIGMVISGGNPLVGLLLAVAWPIAIPVIIFGTVTAWIVTILLGFAFIALLVWIFGD